MPEPTTCPRCERPIDRFAPPFDTCEGRESANCDIAAAAYRRGIERGLEIADRADELLFGAPEATKQRIGGWLARSEYIRKHHPYPSEHEETSDEPT